MRQLISQRPLRYRLAGSLLVGQRLLSGIQGGSPSGSFRALLFHGLPDTQLPAFERLLEHLTVTHEFVTPGEAESILKGETASLNGRRRLLLTFDDGFASQARAAGEILSRYAIKAVFFLCPGLMDLPEAKQRETVSQYVFEGKSSGVAPSDMRLLSWAEAEVLLASGHTVGSHTAFHRRLSELQPEELEKEIVDSAELLERRLGAPIRWFAHPFGNIESIDSVPYEWIRGRYRFSCSGIRGANSNQTHPLALLRDCIDPTAPLEYQDFIVHGGLDLLYRSRARKLQDMARQAEQKGMKDGCLHRPAF